MIRWLFIPIILKKAVSLKTLKLLYDKQLISDYLLDTVYLNTIQKDVVKRFNIADTNKLDAVVKYLFDNIGCETSVRNIAKCLEASGRKISVPTIDTYIQGWWTVSCYISASGTILKENNIWTAMPSIM